MDDIVVEVITNNIFAKALATNERSVSTVNCNGYFHCYLLCWWVCAGNCLIGLVVRRPPRERKIQGSNPACAGIFLGSSHTSDLKIGTPVTTLPGAWCYRVNAGTGQPGVSIL